MELVRGVQEGSLPLACKVMWTPILGKVRMERGKRMVECDEGVCKLENRLELWRERNGKLIPF